MLCCPNLLCTNVACSVTAPSTDWNKEPHMHELHISSKTQGRYTRTHLENEVFAHDPKFNLTQAGHALHMTHEGQQVGKEGQKDSEDD